MIYIQSHMSGYLRKITYIAARQTVSATVDVNAMYRQENAVEEIITNKYIKLRIVPMYVHRNQFLRSIGIVQSLSV